MTYGSETDTKFRRIEMTRRGLVIGCGGTLGFAWTAVALTALDGRTDADPRVARHVGRHPGLTPAGLALAGLRRKADATAALAGLLPRGRGDVTWLRELGGELAGENGWVEHPATWIVGADTRNGCRIAFGSSGAPTAALGDAIAASWVIPGWFQPVRIGGRSYVDGGTVSPTSADLVLPLGLDEVVVVAPMSTDGGAPARGLSRIERVLRRTMTHRLDASRRVTPARVRTAPQHAEQGVRR